MNQPISLDNYVRDCIDTCHRSTYFLILLNLCMYHSGCIRFLCMVCFSQTWCLWINLWTWKGGCISKCYQLVLAWANIKRPIGKDMSRYSLYKKSLCLYLKRLYTFLLACSQVKCLKIMISIENWYTVMNMPRWYADIISTKKSDVNLISDQLMLSFHEPRFLEQCPNTFLDNPYTTHTFSSYLQ